MTAPAAAVNPRSWGRVALALIATLLLPIIPHFRALIPVEQTLLLLVPALAVCAAVGWRLGGRMSFAVIWLILAAWMLSQTAGPPASAYNWMARGWALLLSASFGIVLLGTTGPFFGRALSAVALAMAVGYGLTMFAPGGPERVSSAMAAEFNRRTDESLAGWRERTQLRDWQELEQRTPAAARMTELLEEQLSNAPRISTMLLAALLALESLLILALAWAVYHRLSPTAIGPPLHPLKEFRFNDQLVWGVAVGASIVLLPQFAAARNAGLNLLLFFGLLYFLRGMGILVWMTRGPFMRVALIVATIFALPWIGALAFGIGLGDTWLDLRNRAQAKAL